MTYYQVTMTPPKDSTNKSEYAPVNRLRKKLQIDNLWMWILRLLLEEEKYAYELRKEIKERFGFTPATVTSYAVLYRLERDEYVKSTVRSRFPSRKYYQITEKGIEALKEAEALFEKYQHILFDSIKLHEE